MKTKIIIIIAIVIGIVACHHDKKIRDLQVGESMVITDQKICDELLNEKDVIIIDDEPYKVRRSNSDFAAAFTGSFEYVLYADQRVYEATLVSNEQSVQTILGIERKK